MVYPLDYHMRYTFIGTIIHRTPVSIPYNITTGAVKQTAATHALIQSDDEVTASKC